MIDWPGLQIIADLDIAHRHPTVLGRAHRRIGEVELRLIQRSLGVPDLTFELFHPRLRIPDILLHELGDLHLGLRLLDLAFPLFHAGIRLIDLLLRRRRGRNRVLPVIALLRVDQIGLGLLQIALGIEQIRRIGHHRLLQVDPRLIELTLVLQQRAGRLVHRRLIVTRIELDDDLALPQQLIVIDVEGDDLAGDTRRDRDRAAVGIGVIRIDEVATQPPVENGTCRHEQEDQQEDDADENLAAAPVALPLILLLRPGFRLLRRGLGGPARGRKICVPPLFTVVLPV